MSADRVVFGERDVAFGYFYLTVQNVLCTVIGVLGYSFLARSVSQVDVGAVAGLALLASLFQLLSDFGLSSSLAKFVSELMGRGKNPSGYFLSAFVFRASLALVLSLLLFSFPDRFSVLLFKSASYSSSVRLLSFDVVLVSLASLLSGFLLGAGRLRVLACCGIASVSARWVAIVLFLLEGFGVWGLFWGGLWGIWWVSPCTLLAFRG